MSHRNARLTFHGRRSAGRPSPRPGCRLLMSRRRWASRGSAPTVGWPGTPPRARPACTTVPRARTPVRAGRRRWSSRRCCSVRMAERRGQDWIGPELGVPARTVSRVLRRHQVPYLRECDPLTGEVIRSSKTTAVRYERDRPGELVHMDVKKVGRIPDGGGWRAHGRQMGSSAAAKKARIGYDYVHSLVDDHSRLAYSEILRDEKGPTCAAFLRRAAAYFAEHGIHRIERVHHRQPLQLPPQQRCRGSHRRARCQTQVHPTALPLAERQGGEVQPHPAGRVGLPAGLPHQRRPLRRTCALARAVQHSTPPHRTRRTPAAQPSVTNLTAEYS